MVRLIFLLLFCHVTHVAGGEFYIQPYLQYSSPTSMVVRFELEAPKDCTVKYNEDQIAIAQRVREHQGHLYEAVLQNLRPNSINSYQVYLGQEPISRRIEFRTPISSPRNFSFVAMSDAQHGHEVTTRAVRESVLPNIERVDQDLFPMTFSLFAGDLVQHGSQYDRWKREFFDPIAPLMEKMMMLPALGNHEEDSRHYFSYFKLPENGTPGFEEHWYYVDYGNVRFVTLNTDSGYRIPAQLQWLDRILSSAKNNDQIDFVIAQFHHPHESELWLDGNTEYSGFIEKRLIDFSQASGKPSLYFCGHTHGYSRGHSFKSNHTMMVIGSIGGAVDDWGEYEQADYLEYTKSLDQHGWMLAKVETGSNAQITFERFSFGDDNHQEDLGVVDTFVMKRYNKAPHAPVLKNVFWENSSNPMVVEVSTLPMSDPDHDGLLTTHVQLSTSEDFTTVEDHFIQVENFYNGEDLATSSSGPLQIETLISSDSEPFGRIRFRDRALGWSDWTEF